MSIKRIYIVFLVLLICIFTTEACAENVRNDLADRFPAIADVEIDGIGYVARKRTTTVLLASYNQVDGESGTHLLLSVDDDRKEIRIIYIDCKLMLQTEAEGGNADLPLRKIVHMSSSPKEGFQQMVAALTAAMPLLTIDGFMALDLSGLHVLGIDPTPLLKLEDPALLDQLAALLLDASEQTDDSVSKLYSELGDALITDMKSGVAMRIYSKLDRYTRLDTVPLPTLAATADAALYLDAPATDRVLIDALYMPFSESLAGQIADQAQK